MYLVTYLTVNGNFEVKFPTQKEANNFAKQIKDYKAAGIKIKELK